MEGRREGKGMGGAVGGEKILHVTQKNQHILQYFAIVA